MVNDSNAELLPMNTAKEQNFNGAHLLLISALKSQSTGSVHLRCHRPSFFLFSGNALFRFNIQSCIDVSHTIPSGTSIVKFFYYCMILELC